MSRYTLHALSLLMSVVCVACGAGPDPTEVEAPPKTNNMQTPTNNISMTPPPKEEFTGPTYFKDIAPIMERRCNNCHVDGGIAPFPLNTFTDVKAMAPASVLAIEGGSMPPWLPSDDCMEMQDKREVEPAELALFKEWIATGMTEGNPEDMPEAEAESVKDLGPPDLTIDLGTDYKPVPQNGAPDDYHCFIVDPNIDEDKLINGFVTTPDNKAIVHHILIYSVGPDQHDKVNELDAESPDVPGYTCFGGPKASDANLVAGWVPGMPPFQFEPGHGLRVGKDDLLIVQMHYNTLNDPNGTDNTSFDFVYTKPGEQTTELVMLPVAQYDLDIRAGDANAVATDELELPSIAAIRKLKLYGVVPHMHTLGKSISFTMNRDGEERCLVDIPKWDFNWQGFYLYKEPMALAPNDSFTLRCAFDNSMENNQRLGRQPRDVTWGDGTFDEMCLNYVILTKPPFL